MAYRVAFLPEANGRLKALHDFIADKRSDQIADRFIDAIVAYCQGLKTYPKRGTPRDDIYQGLRVVGFRRRVTIAFSVEGDAVKIAGIFYKGQDYAAALTRLKKGEA